MHLPCKQEIYHIVIVGGGTAGCVLAARLSEIPSLKILLLEAGGNHNEDPRIKIPALFSQAIGDPTLDWDYLSVPQSGLDGKQVRQPRGKGLGGSSLINLLGLVYPSKSDYDAWAELGNNGWDFNSMTTYLQKFQTFHLPNEKVAEDLDLQYIDLTAQGQNGPIHASYQHEVHPVDKAWVDTFRNMGYPMVADTMSGRSLGGYQIVSSINPQTRERSHAGNAYLDLTKERDNIEIVNNVVVDKLIFTGDAELKASGVRFQHNGNTYTVAASKEVILCAGAFGSPCILQRSGVGSRQLLEKFDIDVVLENENVGSNLQDHIMAAESFELIEGIESTDCFRDPSYAEAAFGKYMTDRTGPMTSACVSFAYMPLLTKDKNISDPSLQDVFRSLFSDTAELSPNPHTKDRDRLVQRVLENDLEASANVCMLLCQAHCQNNVMKDVFAFTEPGNYMTLFTALAHPLSRGHVRITASSTDAPPEIDPAYYSHPVDVEAMSRHLQVFDEIINTEPMKSMLKPGGRRIPEWSRVDKPEQAKRLMRYSCMSNLHPCGTCAMMSADRGGVVDDKLRVHGVSGLRVCDASVMPLIPRGNIITSVYAIAEKAADIIKSDLQML